MGSDMFMLAGAAPRSAPPLATRAIIPDAKAVAGLSGVLYKGSSDPTDRGVADPLDRLANATPRGLFTGSVIDYAGDGHSSGMGFLGADARSYRGRSAPGDLADGIIELKGFFHATTAGAFTFSSSHDGAVVLNIGGRTILSGDGRGRATGRVTLGADRLYAVDFIYCSASRHGVGDVRVDLTTDAVGVFVQRVRDPAIWAMILDLGIIDSAMRRRGSAVRMSRAA